MAKYLDSTGLSTLWERIQTLANINGIEYIVGTQDEATNAWEGTSKDKACGNGTLYTGKVIVYHLPVAGTSTAATLNLTLPDGTTTGAKDVHRLASSTVTTTFAAGCDIFMVYNGTRWKVSAYVDSETDFVVDFVYDENEGDYVCSKTYSEITAALAANRKVVGVAKYNNAIQGIYSNVYTTGNSVYFVQLDEGEGSSPEIFSFILSNADELTTSTHRLLQDTDSVIRGANNIWCSITIGSNDAVTVSNNPFTDFDSYIFGNEQSVILKASVTYNSASYSYDVLIHAKYTGTGAANRKYIGITPLEYTNNKYLYLEFTNTTASGKVVEFYSKPSTGIPSTDLASAVQTSLGKADTALQSYTETDPVFTASAAHGITATDIANWNAKQDSLANTQNPYTAQGTSTKVPTITTNNLGQVTTITETNIDFPTLSKGTTSGSGNAVTDISVSGHTITLTKGSTFGTYSKPSGGIPSTDFASAVQTSLGKADTSLQPDVANDIAQGSITSSTGQGFDFIVDSDDNVLQNVLDAKASISAVNAKQDALVSGTNIKTVNNTSLLGSGNVSVGTITGITMNGSSKGTSGVVDLGTVLTAHQDISGKADKSDTYTKAEVNNLIPSIQQDIVVGALPASGTANTIYRVPSTNSYSDYGWDGTQFVLLATYDNAIDDVPTLGSNNLVKSGGVAEIQKNLSEELLVARDGILSYNNSILTKTGATGDGMGYGSWPRTDYMPLNGAVRIVGTSLMNNTNICNAFALHDSDKVLIQAWRGVDRVDVDLTEYPTAVYYMAQSYSKTSSNYANFSITLYFAGSLQEVNEKVAENTSDIEELQDAMTIKPFNFVYKEDNILDWESCIENKRYWIANSSQFVVNDIEIDNPRLGKGISIMWDSSTDRQSNAGLSIPFAWKNNMTISVWVSHNIFNSNRPVGLVGFDALHTSGGTYQRTVWWFLCSLPWTSALANAAKQAVDNGENYTLSISGSNNISFGTLEAYIDDYIVIETNTYWHVIFHIEDYAETSGVALYQATGGYWGATEEMRFCNIIVRENAISQSKDIIVQDPFALHSLKRDWNKFKYNDSYSKENLIIDAFNGGNKTFAMKTTDFSGWSQLTIYHWYEIKTAYTLTKVSKSITNPYTGEIFSMDGYQISNGDAPLPQLTSSTNRNEILYVYMQTRYSGHTAYFQFWIDADELQNVNVIRTFSDGGGAFFNNRIAYKGMTLYKGEIPCVQVVEVLDNMVCLRMSSESVSFFALSLMHTKGGEINTFTIYNPTMIEDCEDIDPYYRYMSHAEKNHPQWIGKTIMMTGDSEHNNGIVMCWLVWKLGVNVYDGHYGGHRMKYINSTSVNNISRSWFYQLNYRKLVLSAPVDAYILTYSSNDAGGGGVLDSAHIKEVMDSYPCYEDFGTEAETSKLAIYNAMTDAQREALFTFQPTYIAYMRQMAQANPYAKFYVCTVPISCGGLLTGTAVPNPSAVNEEEIGEWATGQNPDTARASKESNWADLRTQIIAIGVWFNAKIVDWKLSSGLNYDNFIYHCVDGVHWFTDISENCAEDLINEIG